MNTAAARHQFGNGDACGRNRRLPQQPQPLGGGARRQAGEGFAVEDDLPATGRSRPAIARSNVDLPRADDGGERRTDPNRS